MPITACVSWGEQGPYEMQVSSTHLTIQHFHKLLGLCFRKPAAVFKTLRITYLDNEMDRCILCSDDELKDAFAVGTSLVPTPLRIFVEDSTAHPRRVAPARADTAPLISTAAADSATEWSDALTFTLNGKPITLINPDPFIPLAAWLRDDQGLTGTKIACGEGGCGACTVVMSWTAADGSTQHAPINGCLRPLAAVHGTAITTVEGLGSRRKGYHPIQKKLADSNGSQCGFCSPGWVMSMYGLSQQRPDLTTSEIENHFDGNLCRCTGYRPIFDAMKSFATKSSCSGGCKTGGSCSKRLGGGGGGDIEDAVGGSCHSHAASPEWSVADMPSVPVSVPDAAVRQIARQYTKADKKWYAPATLADLKTLQKQYVSSPAGTVKYVVGNTAYGVDKYYTKDGQPTPYTVYIDVSAVPEFTQVAANPAKMIVGAAVTLAQLIDTCHTQDPDSPQFTNQGEVTTSTATSTYAALARHLLHVANAQVRNAASWAGNVMLASHHKDFPSDVTMCLFGIGATVNYLDGSGSLHANVPIETFYNSITANDAATILVSVLIPVHWGKTSSTATTWTAVDSFKTADRHQNSHAIVNAFFNVEVEEKSAASTVVTSARIAYGGVAKQLFVATRTAAVLTGASLTSATLSAAVAALNEDIDAVGDSTAFGPSPKYRRWLAESMLYKFFLRTQTSLPSSLASGAVRYVRPVSYGAQSYDTDPSEAPVGEAIPKLAAQLQTSGEAEYTIDRKMQRGGLFGYFTWTTQATGKVSAIDTSAPRAAPGVVDVFTAKDVPGSNFIGSTVAKDEMLLIPVGGVVTCIGQQVALVVAEEWELARAAAQLVKVTYTDATTPITTIPEAIAAKSFFNPSDAPGQLTNKIACGDVSAGFKDSAHIFEGEVNTNGQRHFYMETQTTLVTPLEDGKLEVQFSGQWPDAVQGKVMSVTGMAANNVSVLMRRAGGAYGGKGSRNIPVACGAALGAYLTNRPVHMFLERRDDTQATGGREPMNFQYKVGIDKDGVIQAMQFALYADGGFSIDNSFGDVSMAMLWMDNAYYMANYDADATVCKTNLPTNTSMRAPGVVQSVFAMESVLQRIGDELGVEQSEIRERNFYRQGQATPYGQTLKYFSLPTVWQGLKDSVSYDQLLKDCETFNQANRWRKRGVSINPVKYGMGLSGYQSGATVVVYPADGTVQVSHGGCELGQGINTKVAQAAAYVLKCPLTSIRVTAANTEKVPVNTPTGGSGTSESSCKAAMNACQVIVDRLAPFKEKAPTATWAELVGAAAGAGVSMAAEGWYAPTGTPGDVFTYYVYGAACSVVEVDVLTGEYEILRTDINYDSGISLNPDVDIGQIEGAFVMGIGYFTTEDVLFDASGKLLTNGTWNYKPAFGLDIPQELNVSLLKDAPNPVGILRSKASGEPPYALSNSVHFALKFAVASARKSAGLTTPFVLPVPATAGAIAEACATSTSMFAL